MSSGQTKRNTAFHHDGVSKSAEFQMKFRIEQVGNPVVTINVSHASQVTGVDLGEGGSPYAHRLWFAFHSFIHRTLSLSL